MGREVKLDDNVRKNWAFAQLSDGRHSLDNKFYQELGEMKEWAAANVKSRYSFGWAYRKDGYYFGFFFKGIKDALLFRLTWR